MSFIREFWNIAVQLRNFIKLKKENQFDNNKSMIVSRQINENITIGINRNGNQALLYKNNDTKKLDNYILNYLTNANDKLIYHWKDETAKEHRAILEFFKIPPNLVYYKFYKLVDKPDNQMGIFTIPEKGKFTDINYTPIGVIGSKELDQLSEFINNFI